MNREQLIEDAAKAIKPGFESAGADVGLSVTARDAAARAIREVIESFVSDRDKTMRLVHAGGNLPQMRAAVDAARLYNEIIIGLEQAVARALGKDVSPDE